jgi:hypothetical protein
VLIVLGLAVTSLTIAIPLKLSQEAIPIAWSIEGATLAWAAARTRNHWVARAAGIVGLLAASHLVFTETPAIAVSRLLIGRPGFAFAIGIAALAAEGLFLRQVPRGVDGDEYLAPGAGALATGLLLWWGSWEIDGAFGRLGASEMLASAGQFALSDSSRCSASSDHRRRAERYRGGALGGDQAPQRRRPVFIMIWTGRRGVPDSLIMVLGVLLMLASHLPSARA